MHHEAYKQERVSNYSVTKMSLTEAHESLFWSQLRADMLEGKKIAGCWKCDRDDEEGTFSLRSNTNHTWQLSSEEMQSPSLHLKYLELTTGRLCNLKCRTCSSDLSTTWEDDDQALESIYEDRKNYGHRPAFLSIQLDDKSLQALTMIKLTGGEPMMSPEFIPFLDRVIESGRASFISIEIYTNASWIPKDSILSRLNHFKRITICLSIDGIGKINDYIRFPSQWSVVESATHCWVKHSLAYEQFSIVFSPTLNLYNILNLKEMVEWWNNIQFQYFGEKFILSLSENETKAIREGGYIHNVGRFSPTLLQTPSYLSPCLLPDKTSLQRMIFDIKLELNEWLETAIKKTNPTQAAAKESYYRRYLYMIDHIQNHVLPPPKILLKDKNLLKTFLSYTADLDKLRKQNFKEALPELWNQLSSYGDSKGRLEGVQL